MGRAQLDAFHRGQLRRRSCLHTPKSPVPLLVPPLRRWLLKRELAVGSWAMGVEGDPVSLPRPLTGLCLGMGSGQHPERRGDPGGAANASSSDLPRRTSAFGGAGAAESRPPSLAAAGLPHPGKMRSPSVGTEDVARRRVSPPHADLVRSLRTERVRERRADHLCGPCGLSRRA